MIRIRGIITNSRPTRYDPYSFNDRTNPPSLVARFKFRPSQSTRKTKNRRFIWQRASQTLAGPADLARRPYCKSQSLTEFAMIRRWLLSAALVALAVTFTGPQASAGLFSHNHSVGCAPSCAAPVGNCVTAPASTYYAQPACAAPVNCAPATVVCGDPCVSCNGACSCEQKGCVRSFFDKIMDLERRKNQCLKDTFLGWRDNNDCDSCSPRYYYPVDTTCAPNCSVPAGCHW